MDASALIVELKRRRVFRVLVGYGIVAFAVLQVIEPVMHALHLADATLTYTVVALAVGFPVAVVLAWAFDVNEGRIERAPPSQTLRGTRLRLMLVGIGLLAAAPGVIWYFGLRNRARPVEDSAKVVPSIAVLPFADMSATHDQEYFSDGIAEEILDNLAQVDGLKVIGRTSSFSFKGKNEDLRAIGEKLGVGHVLEGSVRKDGNHIRITAQLIAAADASHIWSKSYDREMSSVFALQDEIARAVVEALKVKLLQGRGLSEHKATNPEAYAQYLLGNQMWRDGVDFEKLLPVFERAVALDPTFAPAWGRVAYVRVTSGPTSASARSSGRSETPEARDARRARALAEAEKAVALDPSSADAVAARAYVRMYAQWDWAGSKADYEHALALAPGAAHLARWYGHLLRATGRQEEALHMYRRAVDLDPLFSSNWRYLGMTLLNGDEIAAARSAFRRGFELRPPRDGSFAWGMAWSYLLEGQITEAARWVDMIDDDDPIFLLGTRQAIEYALGHYDRAKAMMDEFVAKGSDAAPTWIATKYARQGDPDRAFEWLERAYDIRDPGLETLKLDAALRSIRKDPRYTALLKKMNLPLD